MSAGNRTTLAVAGALLIVLLAMGARLWLAEPDNAAVTAVSAPLPDNPEAAHASDPNLAKPTGSQRAPEAEVLTAPDDDQIFERIAKSFDPEKDRFFKQSSRTLPDCLKMMQDPRINPDKKFLHGKKAKDFCAIQERYANEILPVYWRFTALRDESFDALRKAGKFIDEEQAKLMMRTPGALVSRTNELSQATEDPSTRTLGASRWVGLMPGDVPDLDALREQIAALKEQAALDMRNAMAQN